MHFFRWSQLHQNIKTMTFKDVLYSITISFCYVIINTLSLKVSETKKKKKNLNKKTRTKDY